MGDHILGNVALLACKGGGLHSRIACRHDLASPFPPSFFHALLLPHVLLAAAYGLDLDRGVGVDERKSAAHAQELQYGKEARRVPAAAAVHVGIGGFTAASSRDKTTRWARAAVYCNAPV